MKLSEKLTNVDDYTEVAMAGLSDMEKHRFLSASGKDQSDAPDEVRAFVTRQMDDGIHPSFLSDGESMVMESNYGKEWYKKWGYVEGDLTEIVTVDRYANLDKDEPKLCGPDLV